MPAEGEAISDHMSGRRETVYGGGEEQKERGRENPRVQLSLKALITAS